MRKRFFTLLMALCSIAAIQAQVRYVAEDGTGNGLSWETASGDIQEMMNELTESGGGEVWVKKGIYKPMHKAAEQYTDETPTTERDKAFVLRTNVKLYGGFAGNEANRSERDWELNETILDGALNETDSVYHVVIAVKSENITLDGFTIRNGRAINSYQEPVPTDENHPFNKSVMIYGTWNNKEFKVPHLNGAGLYYWDVYPITLANLIIKDNVAVTNGGGVLGAYSVPSKLTNIIVENNHVLAGQTGGFYSNWGATEVTEMIIRDNSATANYGGGYFGGENQQIKNLKVENNIAGGIGGGVAFGSTKSIQIDGLTVTGNKAVGNAGGAYFMNVNNADAGGTLVKNASFRRNKTEKAGGGFMVNIATLIRFENIIVEENESEKNSGGIEIANRNTNLKIINSTIKGNTAKTYAAGIGISGNAAPNSQISIINTLIEGNQIIAGTSKFASAIYRPAKSDLLELLLTNVTIVNNTTVVSNGVGGIEDHANTTIQNSIIWGNTNGSNIPSNINATTLSTINHSLIEGHDLTSMNGLDASLIETKQVFIDYENENYHLLPWYTNPVVDSGDDSFISDIVKDIEGNPRFEGKVDLGAYEAQNVYNPFEGGMLNTEGIREFTFTGEEIELSLNLRIDGTPSYSWMRTDVAGSGNDLPVHTGSYTVTATINGGIYDGRILQTGVTIKKATLQINMESLPGMSIGGSAPYTTHELVTTVTPSAAGVNIGYASGDADIACVSGSILIAKSEGATTVTAFLADHPDYQAIPVTNPVCIQNLSDTDASIATIQVNGVHAAYDNDTYIVDLPSETTDVKIIVITNSVNASISLTDGNIEEEQPIPADKTFTGTVTAQNGGGTTPFTLLINTQSNDASISSITGEESLATTTDGINYTLEVKYTNTADIVITPTDENATISSSWSQTHTNLRVGDNIRSFAVTSEDGTTSQEYHVNIKVKNNNAYLSGIMVNGNAATDNGMDYSITLPYCTSADIVVKTLDSKATLSGSQGNQSVTPGDAKTFTYLVTSEDGQVINTYTLTVYVTNSDASVSSVNVGGRKAIYSNNRYTITLPAGTTTTEIEVNTNCPKATVRGHGTKTVGTGENRFIVMVTAEDGTEASYDIVITVNNASNPDPEAPAPIQPVVTITGELPEGVIIEPGLGSHTVREGQSLTLTINLGDEYDGMYVFLQIDEEYILLEPELRSSVYTYTIENIRENMTIGIHLSEKPDPNPDDPTGNLKTETDINIRTTYGCLHIQTGKAGTYKVISISGRIAANGKLIAGETSIHLPQGIYIVVADDRIVKKIVVSEM